MSELLQPSSACPITMPQGIYHQPRDLVAKILPDDQIISFFLYESSTAGSVVVSVPHGGWQYPQSIVNSDNFKRCASLADKGTAELATMLAGGSFPVLLANCGRAICDLNRPEQALDGLLCSDVIVPVPVAFKPYVQAGYGVIPRLSADKQPLYQKMLNKAQWQNILDKWHTPFHQTLAGLLRLARTQSKNVVLVDLHSMPDNPDHSSRSRFFPARSKRLPDFVFGNLHGATLTPHNVGRIDAIMEQTGSSWYWNTPYAGGYITRHYGLKPDKDKSTPHVEVLQIEVNRRLYAKNNKMLDQNNLRAVKQIIEEIVTTLTDD